MNIEHTQEFLSALYAGQTGVLELRSFAAHKDGPPEQVSRDKAAAAKIRRFIRVKEGSIDMAEVQGFMADCERERFGAFFGVSLRTQKSLTTHRGDRDHCQTLTAVFADADDKNLADPNTTVRGEIDKVQPQPSILVDSGGGCHPYWLLELPIFLQSSNKAMADAQHLLRGFASKLSSAADVEVSEVTRVLRLPGSLNFKYDPPRPVTMEYCHPGRRYTEAALGVPPDPAAVTHVPFSVPAVIKKERHRTIFRLLRVLKNASVSYDAAKSCCDVTNRTQCDPPIPEDENYRAWLKRAWDNPNSAEFERFHHTLDTIEQLNEQFAILAIGTKVGVAEFAPDQTFKHLWSFDDFKRLKIKNSIRDDKGVLRPAADFWLKHPDGRRYKHLVYDMPGSKKHCGPDDYNGWQGFAVEPKAGDWSKNREHIRQIICGGSQRDFDWVFNWMAALVQKPGSHAYAALVLRGEQGVGKGHFAHQTLGALFHPQQYLHIIGANMLTGQFNGHLSGKVLVFADEATWGGDRAGADKLQGLVTENTVAIERKYLDAVEEDSALHIIIATNHEWPVNTPGKERRFMVLDVAADKRQDDMHFGPLREELTEGGLAAMLYDLQAHAVDDYALRHPLGTAAKRELEVLSMKPIERWWYERLRQGSFSLRGTEEWPTRVVKQELHEDYLAFLEKHHDTRTRRSTATELGMFLAKYVPEQLRLVDGGERVRFWSLPSLSECRASWLKERDWPKDFPWE